MKKMFLLACIFLAAVSLVNSRSPQELPPAFAPGAWQSVGPPGGNVIAISANAQNANEVFLAAGGGNTTQVYKSTDGGVTWGKISTISSEILDLAVSPLNANTIFALAYSGVYKSTDRGSTWNFIAFPSSCYSSSGRLGLNQADANTVYACGHRQEGSNNYMAVFKSTNGGTTWSAQKISPAGAYAYTYGLAVFPTNPNVVYAGGNYSDGISNYYYKIYKTTNGGNTWTDTNLTPNSGWPSDIVIDPTNSQKVYAAMSGRIIRTSDGGETWGENSTYLYVNRLAVDPVTPSVIYAGASAAFYTSINGGVSFSAATSNLKGTCHSLSVGPSGSSGAMLFGSTAGLFRSTNGGSLWLDCSTGLSANDVEAIGIAGSSPNKLFVECKNNGFYTSSNYGATWQRCADFYRCEAIERIFINPNDGSEIYILAGG